MPSALTLTLPMPIHPQLCWLLPWHAGPLCRLALRVLALPMLVFYLLLETADGVSACTLNHGVVSFDISRMTDQAVRGARTASANARVAVAAERLGGAWGVSSGSEAPRLGVQKSAAWVQKPRVFATGVCDVEPGRLSSHIFVKFSLSGLK